MGQSLFFVGMFFREPGLRGGNPGSLARGMRALLLLSLLLVGCVGGAPPLPELVHDHTPHHGGVVGMVDDRHVEALALADGTVRVVLPDRARAPLALECARGSVTVGSGADAEGLTLTRASDSLAAKARRPKSSTIDARFDLELDGEALAIDFVLPIGARRGGAVGVPLEGCVAPAPGADGSRTGSLPRRRAPRCVLEFASEVSALAITPDASRLLVAAVDIGASAWNLPAVTLELGWDAPPPVVMSEPEAPHREAANAVVVSPDSNTAVVALEARLLLYSLADGKVLRELGRARGIVRNVAWSRDGALLLVSRFHEREATLLRAADGSLLRTLPTSDHAAAVAFNAHGKLAAVGTRGGEIHLFETATGLRFGVLRAGTRTVEALAFMAHPRAGPRGRLVSAGADGVLRVWDVERATELVRRDVGAPLFRLAVSPSHTTFATGDRMGGVRVHADDGKVIETLTDAADDVSVSDLAFAGTTLIASDSRGRVAVWDRASK